MNGIRDVKSKIVKISLHLILQITRIVPQRITVFPILHAVEGYSKAEIGVIPPIFNISNIVINTFVILKISEFS